MYWEFPSYGGQQVLRTGNWKGVPQDMLQKKNAHPLEIELYNLADDSGEQLDVADQHPGIVAKIAALMKREHVPSKQFPFPPIDGD